MGTLGWIEYRLGDPERAEEILTIACNGVSVSRDTAYYLAKVKASLGKLEESQEILAKVDAATGPFFYAHAED